MRNKLFVGLVGLFLAVFLCAPVMAIETFKDDKEMRKFADEFMGTIGKGDLKKAYDFIKPYVSMNSVDVDSAAEESKQIRQKGAIRYGPTKGYQFIGAKKLGDSFYRLLYIEKAEKKVLPWVFYFYKDDKAWRLDEFDWTDQVSVLFQAN